MEEDGSSQPNTKKRRTMKNRIVYSSTDLYDAITSKNQSTIFEILGQRYIKLTTIYKNGGNTVLHLVFKYLEEEYVMQILEKFFNRHFDLLLANDRGETVLHLIITKRMKRVIDFLLKLKALKTLVCDEDGNFITHCFIRDECKRFTKNSKSNDNGNRTRETIEKESASFVEWLLSKGFDFDYKNLSHMSALDLAIEYDLQYILPILLKHTTDIKYVNKKNKRSLLHAFLASKRIGFSRQRYDIEIVKILLDNGVPVDVADKNGDTALHIAVRRGVKMDIVEMLLDRFTEVHREDCGSTLLCEVIRCAGGVCSDNDEYYVRIISHTMAKGVTVKDTDWPKIIDDAIKSKSLRIIKLLNDHGVDFCTTLEDGQNALHKLIATSDLRVKAVEAIFDWLVSQGCDINAADVTGKTPLHLSLDYSGSLIAARKLVALGANVNCREKKRNETPLHLARQADIAKLLLDNGAEVNSKSRGGRRPLHQAVFSARFNDNNDMVKLILERGAYVDVTFADGYLNALSYCVQENHWSCVEELLKYGADVDHETVIDAVENPSEEIPDIEYNDAWMNYCVPHLAKLKAAKLLRCSVVQCYAPKNYYEEFSKKVENEIERLKSTLIDSSTSLYRMLHMDINSRCIYINNEKLVDLMKSELFEKHFPNYYILILASYREAVARKSLLEPAKEAWYDLTRINLPDICVECILGYLSNADLVIMIERDETMDK